jgi:hypothetical protein
MLRGVSHVHTTYSFDGKLSPAELHEFFATRGIQFVLLSEHVETLTTDSINALIAECRQLSDNRCCLIPGVEIDDLNLLIFGITEISPYNSVDHLIEICRNQGALLGYAHPVKKHDVPDAVLEMIETFEVWNTRYDGKLMPRPANLTLLRTLLEQKPAMRPLVGLDFHKPSDFADVFIQVDCDSASGVLSAIRRGAYSLHSAGRSLQLSATNQNWLAATQRSVYTHLYDLVIAWHRWLSERGVTVPRPIKMAFKKIF